MSLFGGNWWSKSTLGGLERGVSNERFLGGGIVSLLLAAGAAVLLYGSLQHDARLRSWPATPGKILSATTELTAEFYKRGLKHRTRTGPIPQWILTIAYSYDVGGQQYEGKQVFKRYAPSGTIESDPLNNEDLIKLHNLYPAEKTVAVHINQSRPEKSYVHFEATQGLIFLIAIGAGFLLLGIILVTFGLRRPT